MELRRRTALIAGGGILVAALVVVLLLRPRDFGALDLPSPNGYDDFLSAAYALRGEAVDYESDSALEALVSTNSESYARVLSGLTKHCRVPIRIDRGYPAAHGGHCSDLPRLKRLTHTLVARAEVARRQGRIAEAAEAYREAYAFATRIGQGGLVVDFLVQIACEAIVLHHFRALIPDLTAEQCAEMLRVMEQAENDKEGWRVVAARQRRWDRAVFSSRERVAHFWARVGMAIRDRSWKPLRGESVKLRDAETKCRNQCVVPVMSILRGRSEGVKVGP